jgi:hypothetical protein
MQNILDLVSELKEKGCPVDDIVLELKNKNVDPLTCYRIVRIIYKNQDDNLEKIIIRSYNLKTDFSFDNPLLEDFFTNTSE